MTISVGNNSNEMASFYHSASIAVTSATFKQLNLTQASLAAAEYTVASNSITILAGGKYEIQLGSGNQSPTESVSGVSRVRVNGVDKLIGNVVGCCIATTITLAIGDVVILGTIPNSTYTGQVQASFNIKRVS